MRGFGAFLIFALAAFPPVLLSQNSNPAGRGVPPTRSISTTAPLAGGGDLTANRTLTCTTCEVTTNKGAPNGYASLTGAATVTQDPTSATATPGLNKIVKTGTVSTIDAGWIPDLSGTYQPLDADLTALAANASNGLWAHTGAGAGAARTITGTANQITVTNGDGISGNPTISLPGTGTAGTYTKVTTDAQGRVTAGVSAPLAIADGGTAGTTAATARSNLGINTPIFGWAMAGSNGITSGSTNFLGYIALGQNAAAADARHSFVLPFACTVTNMYVNVGVRGTLATYSAGSTTVSLMIATWSGTAYSAFAAGNNVITSTTMFTAAGPAQFSSTANDVIAAGSALAIKVVAGTLSVAPTTVDINIFLSCL